MRIKLLSLIFFVSFIAVYAQQDAQFSQNNHNLISVNPGAAGSNNALCATLLGRHQWMGWTGAPKTYLLSVDAPVSKLHGAVGGTIFQDQLGLESTFGAKLAYAYRLTLGSGQLGIGAEIGMVNKGLKAEFVTIDNGDPIVPTSDVNASTFDFGLGVFYKTNNLYAGFSTLHIPQTNLKYQNGLDLSLARHYYILLGYDYQLPVPSLMLKPSVFIKSDASTTQLDVNLSLLYNQMFWGGVSYRFKESVVPMIGAYYNGFKFGVAYDITTSSIANYSDGSLEIMLGYCYQITSIKPVQKYKTVRFL